MNDIVNRNTLPEGLDDRIYFRFSNKRRLQHRARMIEIAVRTELYKQWNNSRQNALCTLRDEIRYLSTKWHDDAHKLAQLRTLNGGKL
jgi:hypothetical protein